MRDVTLRLIVWLAIAMAALAIPLLDLPLWARQHDVQSHAISIVLVAMTLALCFAGPWLARSWTAAVAIVCGSLPMLLVATMLADQPLSRGVLCGGGVALAIAFACLCRRVAWWPLLAPTLALAPIALGYLAADFGASSGIAIARLSPLYWCVLSGG